MVYTYGASRNKQLGQENQALKNNIGVLKHDMGVAEKEIETLKTKLASARATIRKLLEDKHGVRGNGQDFTPHERDWIQERLDLVDQREADYKAEVKKLRMELEMERNLRIIEECRAA
ncbi:hypothetical protein [Rothia koreensis]|uniref:hypothetical protein n=1 Tax=Rothia koreensis TaxID=592378 RepID=UPI003FCCE314